MDKAQEKMRELERSILLMEATANISTQKGTSGVSVDVPGDIVTLTTPGDSAERGATVVRPTVIPVSKSEVEGCSATVRPAVDLSFIREAVKELLKCRRVLKATYCCGYYITGLVSKKQFEHMQVS